jgi:hypothetical protein
MMSKATTSETIEMTSQPTSPFQVTYAMDPTLKRMNAIFLDIIVRSSNMDVSMIPEAGSISRPAPRSLAARSPRQGERMTTNPERGTVVRAGVENPDL